MTNASKWLVAIPFSILVAFVVPGVVAGDFFWFLAGWPDLLYVLMTAGMWLGATAFVDVSRPRGRRDAANGLLPLGLILSVPVAVYDRTHLVASGLPVWVSILGVSFCSLTIICGVWSRLALAGSYTPRVQPVSGGQIVRSGPYRWIRHPLYTSALLWIIGWPLVIASFLSALLTFGFVFPVIMRRIRVEEEALVQAYGDEYLRYQASTARLVPLIY